MIIAGFEVLYRAACFTEPRLSPLCYASCLFTRRIQTSDSGVNLRYRVGEKQRGV